MNSRYVILAVVLALSVVIGFYIVDLDRTDDGALPEVSVEGGSASGLTAGTGDVEVGERELDVSSQ
ncbi:hypothetical protein [Marivita sp. GX14005]|uniref:hypothetical protein n=1 Tax=Marivita sp. GX14005 TaxID=2942276 RepID=UPI0020197B58|nr:hypothetical protein [Marivita sp. GX14005]MCL3880727.1 hypothetical protein [Marivita sp. GX14005]